MDRIDDTRPGGSTAFDDDYAGLPLEEDTATGARAADTREAERRGMGKGLIIGLAVTAALALLAAWLFFWGPLKPQDKPTIAPDNTAPVTSLLAPSTAPPFRSATPDPTDTPVAAPPATATPDANSDSMPPKPAPPTTVALTRWGYLPNEQLISVAGFISAVEEGGTCKLTMTKGDQKITGESKARRDAQTTVCAVNIPSPQKPEPGVWKTVMDYDGPSGHLTSSPVDLEVQ